MNAAALRATFSDYRTVKTRKVLQLILEVPLEQQADVFAALGYPVPDSDIWVAIARLNPGAGAEADGRPGFNVLPCEIGDERLDSPVRITASERGKARYAEADEMAKAVTRAALLAKEPRFREWLADEFGTCVFDEADAAERIRIICHISSRSEIGTKRDAYDRFIRDIEAPYLIATGAMAEPR